MGMIRRALLVSLALLFVTQFLPAQTQAPTSSATAPGQVSGHVYRADTGAPLGGALVTLETVTPETYTSQRTAPDGSYRFVDVVSGAYLIAASRIGFVSQILGANGQSGQKVDTKDLRLPADPTITAMADDALVAAYPERERNNRYADARARFSPDGKFLALMVSSGANQVWLYELQSRQLVLVIKEHSPEAAYPEFQIRDVAWAADDILYVDGQRIGVGSGQLLIAATTSGPKEIGEFPASITAIFRRQAASLHDEGGEDRNDQYVITVGNGNQFHAPVTLAMHLSDGTGVQDIASGSGELCSFRLDSAKSLIFYPKGTLSSFLISRRGDQGRSPYPSPLRPSLTKRATERSTSWHTL